MRIVGDVALAPGTWPRPLLRAIRTWNKYRRTFERMGIRQYLHVKLA
jgi:hypothetical protein